MEQSKNRKSVLFYTVKWRQYSDEVGYQYTVSCALLFQCCLRKIINIRSNLLKSLTETLLLFFYIGYNKNGIFADVIIMSTLRSDMAIYRENIFIV